MRTCESCGDVRTPRTTRFEITGRPFGGVETEDASDDVSDEWAFFTLSGVERVSSGVRGVRGVG